MKSFQEIRKRKLTQEKLAEILNINVSTVSKWESGISKPRLSSISQIAQILEVDFETLVKCFEKQ